MIENTIAMKINCFNGREQSLRGWPARYKTNLREHENREMQTDHLAGTKPKKTRWSGDDAVSNG